MHTNSSGYVSAFSSTSLSLGCRLMHHFIIEEGHLDEATYVITALVEDMLGRVTLTFVLGMPLPTSTHLLA